jgi:hypothetical protein
MEHRIVQQCSPLAFLKCLGPEAVVACNKTVLCAIPRQWGVIFTDSDWLAKQENRCINQDRIERIHLLLCTEYCAEKPRPPTAVLNRDKFIPQPAPAQSTAALRIPKRPIDFAVLMSIPNTPLRTESIDFNGEPRNTTATPVL